MNKRISTLLKKIIFLFFIIATINNQLCPGPSGAAFFKNIVKLVNKKTCFPEDIEERISSLFAQYGHNPNVSFEGGNTLLHFVAMSAPPKPVPVYSGIQTNPQRELILFLFDAGVDVNIPNHEERTPLHLAIAFERALPIALLLEHPELQVNCQDFQGLTPLHFAASRNNVSVIRKLLLKRATLLRDKFNRSPLFYAMQHQHREATSFLLTISPPEDILLTLHQCLALNNPTITSFYAEQIRPLFTREFTGKKTLLDCTVEANDRDGCIFLLENGVNPHQENSAGVSPFFLALKLGNQPIAELLHGTVDLNTLMVAQQPFIHYFAHERYYEAVRILVYLGADPLIKDSHGRSVLYYALCNHEDALITILNQHHEIDRDTVDGFTLPHFFMRENNQKILRKLRELGASFEPIDTKETHPLQHLVTSKKWGHLAESLHLEMSPSPRDEIDFVNAARASGQLAVIPQLIECGMDIGGCDSEGRNLLFFSVKEEDEESTRTFLQLEVNPIAQDNEGNSPLHVSVLHNKSTAIAKMLLPHYHGIVDIPNRKKQTPLHLASIVGNEPVACLLLTHEANVSLQDIFRHTALTYSYEQKNVRLSRLFVRAWVRRILAQQSTEDEFALDVLESSRALAQRGNHMLDDLPFITTMNEFYVSCFDQEEEHYEISYTLKEAYLKAIQSVSSLVHRTKQITRPPKRK